LFKIKKQVLPEQVFLQKSHSFSKVTQEKAHGYAVKNTLRLILKTGIRPFPH